MSKTTRSWGLPLGASLSGDHSSGVGHCSRADIRLVCTDECTSPCCLATKKAGSQ
jgi:hypothetical protein